ncbi:MAG TPA: peptidoglycan-associated lipoprotein Pal [Leucothrix mucor]|uniref:Peptidoglycan-associated lipoprotein n=1 Tax=Leucothrix mucor TaxID=45248 RepID=A0A7V2T1H3_LEUMU|nr:peptidoglycan-associated lipoprotein Pal [Leucothrix mucor]
MKRTTRAQLYLLPLLISALTLAGCSQLQNKKSDKKNRMMTTTVNKSGAGSRSGSSGSQDFSAKDLVGKDGLIGGGGGGGSASTDTFNSQGINSNDLDTGSGIGNGSGSGIGSESGSGIGSESGSESANAQGFGVDPDSQAAIDAEIQAAIDALMTEGKSKPLTPADIKKSGSILAQRIIYFDYDQSTILEKYKPILAAHAELLANYPEMRIRLEGHADERGSREYNVALSERRAETIRQYLSFKNVGSEQMETVAFGEEKPLVPSHDNTAWSKNRRVEINYVTY